MLNRLRAGDRQNHRPVPARPRISASASAARLPGNAAWILRRKTGVAGVHDPWCVLQAARSGQAAQRGRAVTKSRRSTTLVANSRHIVLIDECSMINQGLARDDINGGARSLAAVIPASCRGIG